MIRPSIILWICSLAVSHADDPADLLRFTNGDQLHGTFLGIKQGPKAAWRHNDVIEPVDFKTERIRHIVLHGGRPVKSLESLSNARLVNGDRIPGIIKMIEDDQITIDTTFAGPIQIPRAQVAMLAPNPLGGRVYYHGPFSEDGWKMNNPDFPDGLPDEEAGDKSKDTEASDASNSLGRWKFSGAAWYWTGKQAGTALIRESGMSDRSVLSFEVGWKNRLNIAFAFHADFAKTKPREKDEQIKRRPDGILSSDTSNLPRLFGNSHVLQLTTNYFMKHRTVVDGEGKFSVDRGQMNSNNLRLGESGKAKVEIRSNRSNGEISLFINDEFVTQWNETNPLAADDKKNLGSGFGFSILGGDSPVRISDIVLTEWNGMPDSARSMQVDDQDVVLMANGTDRYAGKVDRLDADNKVRFEGKHGNFLFPLDEVAEIRFARSQLAAATDPPSDNILIRLAPIGSISGQPVSGDAARLRIHSPAMGDVNLSMDSAIMLEFNSSNQLIDTWDVDF